MIPQDNIEKKDFSIILPGITNKISAVSNAMVLELNEGGEPPVNVIGGWQLILEDAIDDLKVIDKALHGS